MLNPNDIASKTFDKGMAGYKSDEVDSYLEQVAKETEALLEEKTVLEKKIVVLADKIEEYREDEDSLKAALIGAQKLGETVIREAKEKADKIQREANKKAEFIVSDAKSAVQREQKALESIQCEVASFKERLIETYRQHVEMINNLADFGPKPKKAQKEHNEKITEKETEEKKSEIVANPSFEEINSENATTNFQNIDSDENNFSEISPLSTGNMDVAQDTVEPTMSFKPPINDSKFGPLKFGDGYDVKRENVVENQEQKGKALFRRKK